jgi:hypothetical protein
MKIRNPFMLKKTHEKDRMELFRLWASLDDPYMDGLILKMRFLEIELRALKEKQQERASENV